MGRSRTAEISFHFRDRESNAAAMKMHAAFDASVDDIFAFAYQAAAVLQRISDAVIERISVKWGFGFDTWPNAGTNSDVRRAMLLFIYNEELDIINSVVVFSPLFSIFETDGKYADIRVNLNNPGVQQFATMLEIGDLLNEHGQPLGRRLLVGGIAL